MIFDTSCEVTKKKAAQDINSEPEMKELKKIFKDMTEEKKTRTGQYLEDQDAATMPRTFRCDVCWVNNRLLFNFKLYIISVIIITFYLATA